MKKTLLIVLAVLAFSQAVFAQRPTGAVVSGATTDGIAVAIKVDTDGTVIVSGAGGSGSSVDANITEIGGVAIDTSTGATGKMPVMTFDANGDPITVDQIVPTSENASTTSTATIFSAATGNITGTILSTLGYTTAVMMVSSGDATTITFSGSPDAVNYGPLPVTELQTGVANSAWGTSGVHVYFANVAGLASVKAVATGYASGAYTVTARLATDVGRAQPAAFPAVVTITTTQTIAQSNIALVTASATQQIIVHRVFAAPSAAVSVDWAVDVGCGAATTPTTTGSILSHAGVLSVTGMPLAVGVGYPSVIAICAPGEDIRYTIGAPTSGSAKITVIYSIY